jgi:hypothetical protein
MNAEADYIRQAIEREQYAAALTQWDDYARHLRHAAESGTLAANQMEEARALYEWARPVLMSAQAHLRDRYHQLEVAAAYRPRPAVQPRVLDTRL